MRNSKVAVPSTGEIIVNLSKCKYKIIHKVVEDCFKWTVDKDPTSEDWDVFWCDGVKLLSNIVPAPERDKIFESISASKPLPRDVQHP